MRPAYLVGPFSGFVYRIQGVKNLVTRLSPNEEEELEFLGEFETFDLAREAILSRDRELR